MYYRGLDKSLFKAALRQEIRSVNLAPVGSLASCTSQVFDSEKWDKN